MDRGFNRPTLAFTITCADQLDYTIRFDRTRDIRVLKVLPSVCALTRITGYDDKGMVRARIAVDRASVYPLKFEPGGAYYLGDYFAKADIDYTVTDDDPAPRGAARWEMG